MSGPEQRAGGPVADDRSDYYADQQAWRERRATAPDAAAWEALADALREVGPEPGGVMHPDLVADRLLDHEWFAATCERKQGEANRVPGPVADERARVIAAIRPVIRDFIQTEVGFDAAGMTDQAQRLAAAVAAALPTPAPEADQHPRPTLGEQMALAVKAMASHAAQAERVDRGGWTDDQWIADAQRLMDDIDGSIMSLVNGHVLALLRRAQRGAADQATLAAVRALADERDVPYPPKFQFGAEANYAAGYRASRARLRALFDGPDAGGGRRE